MERRTVATAVLALLAVLALGAAAATLDSATTTASGGFGSGGASDQSGVGDGEDGPVDLGGDSATGSASLQLSVCVQFLTEPIVQAVLLLGVVAFMGGMYRTTGSWVLSGLFVVSALFPFGVLYLALVSCGASPAEAALGFGESVAANASVLPDGAGSAGSNADGEAVSAPTFAVGLLLLVAIAGSVLLLFVSTGDDDDELAESAPDPPAPERRAEVGRAAGAAADRLEGDADLENEVYRAWREMTGALAVDSPRSTTPAEFADAAVDAGMDRRDVAALTEAFEAVRYGGEPATPEREREAVDALRRIEGTYADGDSAGDAIDSDRPRDGDHDGHGDRPRDSDRNGDRDGDDPTDPGDPR
ncbi:DUF4129 domain-containing protein [Halobaculum sp. CBA1158]|uniref:DUF4129 domain-containing protein n=1 Tax=Halobaculum sp. CBA1158 TaxID=2904243 RepID=UPI001F1FEE93|nr:DUF4129 domain-containing protein [Halobaculum sp. CBA1158]UIP00465.1 DUF4129 domain-containing protein [Halobaculum sp. CBA1158]